MSEDGLPEGWIAAALGDVADVQLGKMLDRAKRIKGKHLPYLRNASVRWGGFDLSDLLTMPFESDELERYSVQRGDLLVCEGGEPGRAAVWEGGVSNIKYQKAILRVRPGPAISDPRWIMYSLRHDALSGNLEQRFTGSTIKHFPRQAVLQYEIRIPPLVEQKRIVAKLEELLARVNAAREALARVLAILKRFRQAVLAAACEGRLTEAWREEHRRDGDWPSVVLGSVVKDTSYGSASKSSVSGKVPVLRMGNIQDGRLDWDDLVYTSDPAEIKKYRLSAGDLLFNRTNSPELVGKTAVYRGERDAIYAGYLIRVRCTDQLLPDYLNYCLNGPAGKEYLMQVKTDGVSQSNINAKKLAAFEFGLPAVNEQEEIVRRVEALFKLADAIAKHVAAATARAERLTQAILAKAFRGELVPTEADLARRGMI